MPEVSHTATFGINRGLGEELPNAFNLSLTERRQKPAELPWFPQKAGASIHSCTFPDWPGFGVEASCPSLDMETGQWNKPSLFLFF